MFDATWKWRVHIDNVHNITQQFIHIYLLSLSLSVAFVEMGLYRLACEMVDVVTCVWLTLFQLHWKYIRIYVSNVLASHPTNADFMSHALSLRICLCLIPFLGERWEFSVLSQYKHIHQPCCAFFFPSKIMLKVDTSRRSEVIKSFAIHF